MNQRHSKNTSQLIVDVNLMVENVTQNKKGAILIFNVSVNNLV